MKLLEILDSQKKKLKNELDANELAMGEIIFNNGQCQVLSQSIAKCELIINDEIKGEMADVSLEISEDEHMIPFINNEANGWDRYGYACLLQMENELSLLTPKEHVEHKKYTRQGMMKRVLNERLQKAEKANYRIHWADNIYGDHVLTNESGVKYKVFLRDFDQETGYSNSMDSQLNKLGTTKHIMFAFKALKEDKALYARLDKTFPFVEIFCNPLNNYQITWHYPHMLTLDDQLLISRYFKNNPFVEDDCVTHLLGFIEEAREHPHICIRPEVIEKIEKAFELKLLDDLRQSGDLDWSGISADLYPYQKEGIEFALYRKSAIIADEMGLGKTLQAMGVAVLKKQIFGFSKTLVVCPASIKEQWKNEIEKFTSEKALNVSGFPDERALQYKNSDCFFIIVNYETVMRDYKAINQAGFDFLILDEVQRAKNYETKTANSLKRINVKHTLAITGTPIENRLIDIFSIMGILDPEFFGPLWEFSYQFCLFDPERHNKINGYYNLQKLNRKLDDILIRREKRKVIEQLPHLQQINIPVTLSPLQAEYHSSYARGLAQIIRKKYLTPYDLQRMQLLLASMRMVCDSTYLIDEKTNESPKLEELRHILLNILDVANREVKIIIFSEWIKVHKLIGQLLRENNIGFVELNGKIPVAKRGDLIRKFETNPQYKIFLSTESGGSGLNLQIADTLINFELPWNPAKKNQRIGRIDRLGQKSNNLTIYNFITRNSIETQIASGLLVKQSLFDGVLGEDAKINFVDFSSKGRSQFIQQLEDFISLTENRILEVETEDQSLMEIEQPDEATLPEQSQHYDLDFSEESNEKQEVSPENEKQETSKPAINTEDLEAVMNNGMQFLSGLFKMTTGKDMGMEGQKIDVNKETGEVTMKFKLPI